MKDQIISLETAKLAKEKGFNLRTLHWYGCDKPGGGCEPNKLMFTNYGYTNVGELETQDGTMVYSAPTQSLLQTWLREEHRIIISIIFTHFHLQNLLRTSDKDDYACEINTGKSITTLRYNKTYEEALEKGLQEALSAIKKE